MSADKRKRKRKLPGADASAGQPHVEVDQDKLAELMARMHAQQSLPLGLVAGLVAGALAAVVWALLVKFTGYEIAWVAIGVGFLVGIAVRRFGRGIDARFNLLGALLALLAVIAGKVLALGMIVAAERGIGPTQVFEQLTLERVLRLLQETFHLLDILIYALAIWAGWQYASRRITQEELAAILRPTRP